ncbi:gamma-glutamyl hydrolase-like [Halichondria panicea]|uniref:gamma-glutamyl hydrolase-like n=1 Tax=Halichondria panicea TaxID=6063 RepID=UPI00312B86C3
MHSVVSSVRINRVSLLGVLGVCSCLYGVRADTTRPIIGIVSEKSYSSEDSYIAASYVKFIESAGGRVAPILSSSTDEEINSLFSSINGVLFPGGGVSLNSSGYGHVGSVVLQLAMKANDAKDYFPVWGTCLGFELLCHLVADKGTNVLSRVDATNLPLPLSFTDDAASSRIFSYLTPKLLTQLSSQSITFNSHSWGVATEMFQSSHLHTFFKMLSTNKDRNGVDFVSTIESYDYPFYGVQWHPEKNGFEWTPHEDIPHTEPAVAVMQGLANFFVQEARKSSHSFPSASAEEAALIYQHTPTYTGDHSNFTQIYTFKH